MIVNLTGCSLNLDRVNIVAPASHAYRARPNVLTPAVCMPLRAVGVPGGAVQTRTVKGRFSSDLNAHELSVENK